MWYTGRASPHRESNRLIDLSIIIVSWNVEALLVECLNSILRSPVSVGERVEGRPVVEIIVVDSGSTDGTVERLKRDYPQVTLLAQAENIGFTRANNLGLKIARGRHLLLLNPDTVVLDDALGTMIAYLDANPDVGLIGPHTRNTDGSTQSTRRRFPSLAVAFFESTWLQPYAPKHLLDSYYVVDGNGVRETIDVDWVQGSAIMARREVYEQIGGLDEGYIMYSEELDWCRRAKDAGWRVVYLGDAEIIHHGGKSTEQAAARSHILFQQSKLRYFRLYHGRLAATVLRLFLLANYAVQLGLETLKWLLGHKRALRSERIRAYSQVLRSGLKGS
nr:MAG: glycosyltransferase family 2 protein [Chloroflexota bacterium]